MQFVTTIAFSGAKNMFAKMLVSGDTLSSMMRNDVVLMDLMVSGTIVQTLLFLKIILARRGWEDVV